MTAATGGPTRVSVIVPTRDRPALVEAAVRSLLLQTRPVDQIVVVDDASTSTEHLATLRTLSPAIEIARHELPRGAAAARNTGLAHASGTHVLFLDDDDLIHPRLVEDGLLTLAARPEADVVVFLYECVYTPGSLCDEYPVALLFDYERLPVHPLRLVDGGNPVSRMTLESRPVSAFLRFLIPIHSCLLRRSALGDARFPEALTQGEDTYFWISLAAAGRRFVLDDRVYAFVRRHPGNTTRSRTRYVEEIQACYERLLGDGLLTAPDDAFLAHLKLFWFKDVTHRPGRARHATAILTSPRLLLREAGFWLRNLRSRRRLLRYYFSG